MKKIIHVFTVSMSIIFLEDIYKKLKNQGYELIIICSDGDEVRFQEKIGNIKYYPVNMSRGINPLKDLIALIKIILIFFKEKPNVVHGHTPKGGLLAMVAAKFLFIKNRPYHLHGLKYPSEIGIRKMVIKGMEKVTIMLATKVFAVSRSLRQYAVNEGLGTKEKIQVLLNGSVKGIDIKKSETIRQEKYKYVSELEIVRHDIVIGYVGRITEEKGVFNLFEAYQKLLLSGYDIGMILCGSNEIKKDDNSEYFMKFIDLDSVQYFGQVKEPQKYMICCDIFVLPSLREGFGLVNIEANSVGVPVVTTNIVGCIESIQDKVTGVLIEPNNVDQLYQAIETLINDSDIRLSMGLNGVKRVRELYDRDNIWDALIDEYEKMS